jgi:phosphohistidine phosphatase
MAGTPMLTLSLLRHAKSSWDDPTLADHDRPLNDRGNRDAPRMAAFIRDKKLVPDRILCSTAIRTRATLKHLLAALPKKPPVSFEKGLYLAEAPKILATIEAVREATARLMLIGHSPGLHDLAMALVGKGDRQERFALMAKFPTATLAVITFDLERWHEIEAGMGRLEIFMTPRRLD